MCGNKEKTTERDVVCVGERQEARKIRRCRAEERVQWSCHVREGKMIADGDDCLITFKYDADTVA